MRKQWEVCHLIGETYGFVFFVSNKPVIDKTHIFVFICYKHKHKHWDWFVCKFIRVEELVQQKFPRKLCFCVLGFLLVLLVEILCIGLFRWKQTDNYFAPKMNDLFLVPKMISQILGSQLKPFLVDRFCLSMEGGGLHYLETQSHLELF